jgi:hypothetical protein
VRFSCAASANHIIDWYWKFYMEVLNDSVDRGCQNIPKKGEASESTLSGIFFYFLFFSTMMLTF